MKPWIIVLIVLAVIAVILGLLYYFGKKAQTKQAAQQEQMEAMKQTVSMLIIDKKKLRMKDSGLPQQKPFFFSGCSKEPRDFRP